VTNKKFITLIATALLLLANALPSHAAGKYDWWEIRSQGGWFRNGVICWTKSNEIKIGNKVTFSVKLGQSRTFKKLGTAVGVSGDKLISATWDRSQPDDLEKACGKGSKSVAFISPKTPEAPGAYILRIGMYNSKGRFLWNDDYKVLNDTYGADSGTSYFTNPPALFFTKSTYEKLNLYRTPVFTSQGNNRNACLVIFDQLSQTYSGATTIITKKDLIYRIQQGGLGVDLRRSFGGYVIPIAIKCAPWMVDYLPLYE
jgi:hypothetical protein